MGPRVVVLMVFIAFVCGKMLDCYVFAQGLKCNYCKSIDKNHPYCEQTEEQECSMTLTNCIRITMHEPAYGEVRRCASANECEEKVPHLVERECCNTDLCN